MRKETRTRAKRQTINKNRERERERNADWIILTFPILVSVHMLRLPDDQQQRICVVGAGAAGLCVAKRIVACMPNASVDVFEQCAQLGGTWVLQEEHRSTTTDTNKHSSMYAGLRTNLPKEIMAFDNFPFEPCDFAEGADFAESFPPWHVVLAYLQRFARPIEHLIKFRKRVSSIEPINGSVALFSPQNGQKPPKLEGRRWEVTVQDSLSGQRFTAEQFDAIFVCNGHYWCPRLPSFAHKLDSSIRWLHSHDYRRADHFAGQRVAVVGANVSGKEIALLLMQVAKKVYLSHSSGQKLVREDVPPNLEEVGRTVDAMKHGLVLDSGRTLSDLDSVIFCTGYRLSFPFFHGPDSVISCGDFVSPLFAQVAHAQYADSLFFIGIQNTVIPFHLFEVQTRLAIALMEQRNGTPAHLLREQTEKYEQQRISSLKEQGIPLKYFHRLGSEQWAYFDWLDTLSGHKTSDRAIVQSVFERNAMEKERNQLRYRDLRYRILDRHNYEVEEKKHVVGATINQNYRSSEF